VNFAPSYCSTSPLLGVVKSSVAEPPDRVSVSVLAADSVSTPAPDLISVDAPIVVPSDHSVIRPLVPVTVETTPVVVVLFMTPVASAPSDCSFVRSLSACCTMYFAASGATVPGAT